MLSLRQALAWIPGGELHGDGAVRCARVHSDTRTLAAGDLFVAIRGERFDANDMLAQAKAAGATAALCLRGASGGFAVHGLPCIEVDDTIAALGLLARGWRTQFMLPLVAVTGSNGKTTVTQMVAAILRAAVGEAAFATQGNLNNDIGVPLTLLRLRAGHRLGVVELGMNHPGEIAELAAIARPTVAVVNNAQREHMEFMATVEAVARENGSVIAALPAGGTVVLPAADTYTPLWREMAGTRRVITFGVDAPDVPTRAEVRADEPRWSGGAWQVRVHTPQGGFALRLRIAGRHNVQNALAATACALAAGVPIASIAAGLAAFEPVKGRSRALALAGGRTLVDDSYNANPDSVAAAIAVLAALPGPRLLVLGDMGEVGDAGPRFHAEAGAQARAAGIEHLFALGAQSAGSVAAFGAGARHFDDVQALIASARALQPQIASVLVKGSRFMRMERVVEALQQEGTHAA